MAARASNRAIVGKDGHVTLPAFSLFGAGSDAPHRHMVVASYTNERGVVFKIKHTRGWSRPRMGSATRTGTWWIDASKDGYRMSVGTRTSSPDVAAAWISAVARGDVSVAERSA